MALKKIKTTKSGHSAEYHRIIQLNMNYDRLDAVVTVAMYKDKASRDAGDKPIESSLTAQDLGLEFHDGTYSNGEDVMKNVSLKEAYKALDKMAKAEDLKTEEEGKDEALAFFADAVEA